MVPSFDMVAKKTGMLHKEIYVQSLWETIKAQGCIFENVSPLVVEKVTLTGQFFI